MDVASTEITSERLRLRPWRAEEAERLFDIRRRADVAKWLGDPTPWPDVSLAEKKIAAWREAAQADGPLGVWAVTLAARTDHAPLGSVSIGQLPGSDEIEIGWYLHPDSAGQGYASEAAQALLHHTLGLGVPRIWALMWPNNYPSARVARTIGMSDLGVIQDPWYGSAEEPMSQIFQARP